MAEVDRIWRQILGEGPLIATAIHDGHAIREALVPHLALSDDGRLREEDPFTGGWTAAAGTRVIGLRSRFEVDLNRPPEKAVYLTPADAWGLQVWKDRLPEEEVAISLRQHELFYEKLRELYQSKAADGPFVVYDLHTYNHRRQGPDGPEADPEENPQVNIGTGTMPDRDRFAGVIGSLIDELRRFDFPGGRLDVRENVKFLGGYHARWAHHAFPETACVIAVEFKKIFMDEWSGAPDPEKVEAIGAALAATVPAVLDAVSRVPPPADHASS